MEMVQETNTLNLEENNSMKEIKLYLEESNRFIQSLIGDSNINSMRIQSLIEGSNRFLQSLIGDSNRLLQSLIESNDQINSQLVDEDEDEDEDEDKDKDEDSEGRQPNFF